MSKSKAKIDVHQHITNYVIDALESVESGSWELPWHRVDAGQPTNVASKNAYNGMNVITLWISCHVNDFQHSLWGTYNQWKKLGAQVRKGQKGTPVVYYREFKVEKEDDNGKKYEDTIPIISYSTVFNVDQVDDYEMPASNNIPLSAIERQQLAEEFIAAQNAQIDFGGGRAYFRPSEDRIQMPLPEHFKDTKAASATENYYSTLLHELVHWTGHSSRLDRLKGQDREAYAFEELVAELGSAFLCSELQITPTVREDHIQYLKSWLGALKQDKKFIFRASRLAADASKFMHKNYEQTQSTHLQQKTV